MASAADIQVAAFKNDTLILMARVVGADGSAVVQAEISSAAYTIYLLDDDDPDSETAVAGHADVAVAVTDLIFDALQEDDLWDSHDATGYNFRHTLDVSEYQAFAVAGRKYRVRFELTPVTGQVIVVRFRVTVI